MRKRVGRAVAVVGIAVGMLLVGGIGLFRAVGSSPRPVVRPSAPAVTAPPVVVTGSLTEQISILQARLRLVPNDWSAYASLGADYVQQARITADPTYYPKAQGVLQRSLALDTTDNFQAMTGMATLAAARHDFAGALSWGRRASAIDPANANIHAIMGDALVELGRYPEAFAEFQKGLDLKPKLPTYARGSYALELQGNVPAALHVMGLALESAGTASDSAWASNQLGELEFNSGNLDAAADQYRRATQVDPTFIPPHAGLAKVEAALGEFGRAIADYQWVVARYPTPEYVIALGDLYTVTGRPDQAAQQYGLVHVEERLLQANGVNVDLEIALFDADHRVDLSAGLSAARAEWARRHSINVADALAWELHANGRDEEALAYSNQALHLGTRNALFFFHRGMIERALGRTDAARRDLAQALSINPHFSILWSKTAVRTLARMGGAP